MAYSAQELQEAGMTAAYTGPQWYLPEAAKLHPQNKMKGMVPNMASHL